MGGFIPVGPAERLEMLHEIGLNGVDDLFAAIPSALRLDANHATDLPAQGLSEWSVLQKLRALAARNRSAVDYPCFLGAGVYDHYQPAAIRHLLQRQEFYTAYTPYQPEISQGTLQGIFEFQSYICRLTDLPIANASMYDGASAAAEALLMACRATGRQRVWLAGTLHPQYIAVIKTYMKAAGLRVTVGNMSPDGSSRNSWPDPAEDLAALMLQSPNFFGVVESLQELSEQAHAMGALAVVSCDPISLSLLQSPGACAVDIATGEAQPLGNAMSYGGPAVGYLAATAALLRRMPGRIVGQTTDREGRTCYVLTIQAREQHIRREKATSNICTNQALCALTATLYLALNGQTGLREVAEQSAAKAIALHNLLLEPDRQGRTLFEPVFAAPFFREFAVRLKSPYELARLNRWLSAQGMIGGLDLGQVAGLPALAAGWHNVWLLAVTEKRSREELFGLVEHCREFAAQGGDFQ